MDESIRTPDVPVNDLPFDEFQSLYGPWEPLQPMEVAALFEAAPFPWWIAGGWALSAARSLSRAHEDLDVAVLSRDIPAVRRQLADHHLWEANSGMLRPLRPGDTMTEGCEQLWVRHDARSPWFMDILVTPSEKDEWLFKRDHRIRRPLAEIGRSGAGGVRYLRPEIVLLFKAKLLREKDQKDFEAFLPDLDIAAQRWLAEALAMAHPGHEWLAVLPADP